MSLQRMKLTLVVSQALVAVLLSAQQPAPNGDRPITQTDARGIVWAQMPAGSFEMGCVPGDEACENDERPRHAVTLTRPFWMQTTEVTVGQFRASGIELPVQPDWNRDERQPVVRVTWDEATRFCQSLGGRLPTEAEWEYAARGGRNGSTYVWGNGREPKVNGRPAANVGDDRLTTASRWKELVKSGRKTGKYFDGYDDGFAEAAPVGTFVANPYGLYDMAGNVWEWVADWYSPNWYQSSPRQDPAGPPSGTLHVIRGGAWNGDPAYLRISVRAKYEPGGRSNVFGIRCAKDGWR